LRQTLARVIRLTAGYSLVTLLGPVFTVVLTPLYTRLLVPADYGVVEAATTLAAFINTLVLFSFDQALSAHYFDGDDSQRRSLVTSAVMISGALGLLAGAGLLLLAQPLAILLFKDPGRRLLIDLLAVEALATPLYTLLLTALRLQTNVRRVNALALTFLLATVISNVVLILVLHYRATGVVAANTIATVLACGLGLALAWPLLRGRFSPALAGALLRTGASLLPGAFSFLVLAGIDRVMLTQYVSQTDLGLYSIANKLASLLFVVLSAAWYAWWPLALEMGTQPDAPRQYARMLEYFTAAGMVLGLGLGLLAPEILALATRTLYVPAAPYALVLMAYYGPLGFAASSFFIGLYIRKRTHWISLAYLAAAAANVGLNLWLDTAWGVWGAVWATIGASLVLVLIAYFTGQATLKVPYRLGRLLALSAVYSGAVAAYLAVPALGTLVGRLALLAAMSAAVLVLGIVTPRELLTGWQAAQRALARRLATARSSQSP
jgi:O-antigen/teichoic acid export membrane protein